MTTRMFRLGGWQAGLFAGQQRGGFELSDRCQNSTLACGELLHEQPYMASPNASLPERIVAHSWYQSIELLREMLGSSVRRERRNIHDLTPRRFGEFDNTHPGVVLPYLRGPLKALWNMRQVTRMDYRRGAGHDVWRRFDANALRAMIKDAGFAYVEEVARFRDGPRGQPQTMWHIDFRASV